MLNRIATSPSEHTRSKKKLENDKAHFMSKLIFNYLSDIYKLFYIYSYIYI